MILGHLGFGVKEGDVVLVLFSPGGNYFLDFPVADGCEGHCESLR